MTAISFERVHDRIYRLPVPFDGGGLTNMYLVRGSRTAVIDTAVQIFGGLGVTHGVPVESLYREIRALRIYEGASEVQKVVIARHHLSEHRS